MALPHSTGPAAAGCNDAESHTIMESGASSSFCSPPCLSHLRSRSHGSRTSRAHAVHTVLTTPANPRLKRGSRKWHRAVNPSSRLLYALAQQSEDFESIYFRLYGHSSIPTNKSSTTISPSAKLEVSPGLSMPNKLIIGALPRLSST